MKIFLKKNRVYLISLALFLLFCFCGYIFNFQFALRAFNNFKTSFIEMVSMMPFMFILIGLFDTWVSKEVIEKQIGERSGIKGMLWVILLAMFQMGPLYVAFPVAYLLWQKGASTRNIFVYIGAFTTIKIPMISFEIGYLGLKFSLLRTLFSLPIFILIAIVMDLIYRKELKMNNPSFYEQKK